MADFSTCFLDIGGGGADLHLLKNILLHLKIILVHIKHFLIQTQSIRNKLSSKSKPVDANSLIHALVKEGYFQKFIVFPFYSEAARPEVFCKKGYS